MKKIKEPDKKVVVYVVLEMMQSEVEGIIQRIKDNKELKYKYYWLDQDWSMKDETK